MSDQSAKQGSGRRLLAGGFNQSTSGQQDKKNQADEKIVFDTTGSMNPIIAAMVALCKSFVDESTKRGIHPLFSVVSFGDVHWRPSTDRIETAVEPTDKIEVVKHGLSTMYRNDGYGNDGESSLEAIVHALNIRTRPGSVNVMLLITDEPAHMTTYTADQITGMLKERLYLLFAITPDFPYFRQMANATGGEWWDIWEATHGTNADKVARDIVDKVAKQVAETVEKIQQQFKGQVKLYLEERNKPKR